MEFILEKESEYATELADFADKHGLSVVVRELDVSRATAPVQRYTATFKPTVKIRCQYALSREFYVRTVLVRGDTLTGAIQNLASAVSDEGIIIDDEVVNVPLLVYSLDC